MTNYRETLLRRMDPIVKYDDWLQMNVPPIDRLRPDSQPFRRGHRLWPDPFQRNLDLERIASLCVGMQYSRFWDLVCLFQFPKLPLLCRWSRHCDREVQINILNIWGNEPVTKVSKDSASESSRKSKALPDFSKFVDCHYPHFRSISQSCPRDPHRGRWKFTRGDKQHFCPATILRVASWWASSGDYFRWTTSRSFEIYPTSLAV